MGLTVQQRDLVNHKFQGFKDMGHKELKCSQCGELLGGVTLVKTVSQEYIDSRPEKERRSLILKFGTKYYRAKCFQCDDYSYPTEITGETITFCREDLNVVDITWDDNLCTIFTRKKGL